MLKNTLAACLGLLVASNLFCYESVARDNSWVTRSYEIASAPTQLTVTKSTLIKSPDPKSSIQLGPMPIMR